MLIFDDGRQVVKCDKFINNCVEGAKFYSTYAGLSLSQNVDYTN
jgi:hypothetical protein